jgi:hypothetical protein
MDKIIKYNPEQLCYWLKVSRLFENLKCSKTLGVARFNYKDSEVLVSASGRISVRDGKQTENLIALISKCVWPAKYCICNLTALDCARGLCGYCADHVCEAIGGENAANKESDLGRDIIKKSGGLKSTFNKIGMLAEQFKRLADAMCDELHIESAESRRSDEQFDEINKEILDYMISAKREENASLGIYVAGIAANIKDSIDKILNLNKIGVDRTDIGALIEARNIVMSGFNSLVTINVVGAFNAINSYNGFFSQNKNVKKEILEISRNGLEIAKLVNRPIPK